MSAIDSCHDCGACIALSARKHAVCRRCGAVLCMRCGQREQHERQQLLSPLLSPASHGVHDATHDGVSRDTRLRRLARWLNSAWGGSGDGSSAEAAAVPPTRTAATLCSRCARKDTKDDGDAAAASMTCAPPRATSLATRSSTLTRRVLHHTLDMDDDAIGGRSAEAGDVCVADVTAPSPPRRLAWQSLRSHDESDEARSVAYCLADVPPPPLLPLPRVAQLASARDGSGGAARRRVCDGGDGDTAEEEEACVWRQRREVAARVREACRGAHAHACRCRRTNGCSCDDDAQRSSSRGDDDRRCRSSAEQPSVCEQAVPSCCAAWPDMGTTSSSSTLHAALRARVEGALRRAQQEQQQQQSSLLLLSCSGAQNVASVASTLCAVAYAAVHHTRVGLAGHILHHVGLVDCTRRRAAVVAAVQQTVPSHVVLTVVPGVVVRCTLPSRRMCVSYTHPRILVLAGDVVVNARHAMDAHVCAAAAGAATRAGVAAPTTHVPATLADRVACSVRAAEACWQRIRAWRPDVVVVEGAMDYAVLRCATDAAARGEVTALLLDVGKAVARRVAVCCNASVIYDVQSYRTDKLRGEDVLGTCERLDVDVLDDSDDDDDDDDEAATRTRSHVAYDDDSSSSSSSYNSSSRRGANGAASRVTHKHVCTFSGLPRPLYASVLLTRQGRRQRHTDAVTRAMSTRTRSACVAATARSRQQCAAHAVATDASVAPHAECRHAYCCCCCCCCCRGNGDYGHRIAAVLSPRGVRVACGACGVTRATLRTLLRDAVVTTYHLHAQAYLLRDLALTVVLREGVGNTARRDCCTRDETDEDDDVHEDEVVDQDDEDEESVLMPRGVVPYAVLLLDKLHDASAANVHNKASDDAVNDGDDSGDGATRTSAPEVCTAQPRATSSAVCNTIAAAAAAATTTPATTTTTHMHELATHACRSSAVCVDALAASCSRATATAAAAAAHDDDDDDGNKPSTHDTKDGHCGVACYARNDESLLSFLLSQCSALDDSVQHCASSSSPRLRVLLLHERCRIVVTCRTAASMPHTDTTTTVRAATAEARSVRDDSGGGVVAADAAAQMACTRAAEGADTAAVVSTAADTNAPLTCAHDDAVMLLLVSALSRQPRWGGGATARRLTTAPQLLCRVVCGRCRRAQTDAARASATRTATTATTTTTTMATAPRVGDDVCAHVSRRAAWHVCAPDTLNMSTAAFVALLACMFARGACVRTACCVHTHTRSHDDGEAGLDSCRGHAYREECGTLATSSAVYTVAFALPLHDIAATASSLSSSPPSTTIAAATATAATAAAGTSMNRCYICVFDVLPLLQYRVCLPRCHMGASVSQQDMCTRRGGAGRPRRSNSNNEDNDEAEGEDGGGDEKHTTCDARGTLSDDVRVSSQSCVRQARTTTEAATEHTCASRLPSPRPCLTHLRLWLHALVRELSEARAAEDEDATLQLLHTHARELYAAVLCSADDKDKGDEDTAGDTRRTGASDATRTGLACRRDGGGSAAVRSEDVAEGKPDRPLRWLQHRIAYWHRAQALVLRVEQHCMQLAASAATRSALSPRLRDMAQPQWVYCAAHDACVRVDEPTSLIAVAVAWHARTARHVRGSSGGDKDEDGGRRDAQPVQAQQLHRLAFAAVRAWTSDAVNCDASVRVVLPCVSGEEGDGGGGGGVSHGTRAMTFAEVDVYYPRAFAALQACYAAGDRDGLLSSLRRCAPYAEAVGGKTRGGFYVTHDRRFLLKRIKAMELRHFAAFAPHYFAYMQHLFAASPSLQDSDRVEDGDAASQSPAFLCTPSTPSSSSSSSLSLSVRQTHRQRQQEQERQLCTSALAKILGIYRVRMTSSHGGHGYASGAAVIDTAAGVRLCDDGGGNGTATTATNNTHSKDVWLSSAAPSLPSPPASTSTTSAVTDDNMATALCAASTSVADARPRGAWPTATRGYDAPLLPLPPPPTQQLADAKSQPASTLAPDVHYYALMQNLACDEEQVVMRYDLKGSQRNRTSTRSDVVRLDEDLVQQMRAGDLLCCRDAERRRVLAVLARDARLLAGASIIDYSTLVLLNARKRRLVVGVIDYLHPYNSIKVIESKVKSGLDTVLRTNAPVPTIIDPEHYQRRFIHWMREYICAAPRRAATKTSNNKKRVRGGKDDERNVLNNCTKHDDK